MFDINVLEKQCPRCSGLGRIGNPTWLHFWTSEERLIFTPHILETKDNSINNDMLNQPTEPMFFVCRECNGKGKVLTSEGKQFIEFVRFWTNPNH